MEKIFENPEFKPEDKGWFARHPGITTLIFFALLAGVILVVYKATPKKLDNLTTNNAIDQTQPVSQQPQKYVNETYDYELEIPSGWVQNLANADKDFAKNSRYNNQLVASEIAWGSYYSSPNTEGDVTPDILDQYNVTFYMGQLKGASYNDFIKAYYLLDSLTGTSFKTDSGLEGKQFILPNQDKVITVFQQGDLFYVFRVKPKDQGSAEPVVKSFNLPALVTSGSQEAVSQESESQIRSGNFDFNKVKVGDKVLGLTIKLISSPTGRMPLSDENFSMVFQGRVTLNARYSPPDHDSVLGDLACFDNFDEASLAKLPRANSETRREWFCAKNSTEVEKKMGNVSGTYKITIDSYTINMFPGEFVNEATIVFE